ncbi:outer membrane beta-barrel protein [Mucilaginibacter polytrichastri]|uniref:Outer membrane protein beta-barrel domain-containing protein n=1 Tax=Mucilaginibacter polytrichastri TaxID=1302689 RepID=A0A1Q6A4K7_9SPHI|nr:outer membrane beta-barrel protein [Mucilaginibacter polytrichastri]OKS88938.1 hypothetical protein RG47T_4416 [Mucilaginibacter polytrichastri]SFT25574.1 CarboxypepD_reg-like domain-containing protein [Mucilaginibacter polytrichastri]
MKKRIPLLLLIICLTIIRTYAQGTHEVRGTIIDTTKQTLPGSVITLVSDQGDSVNTAANVDGKFVFPAVKGLKITLTIASIGYESVKKHFALPADPKPVDLGSIMLRTSNTTLNEVKIVGVNPIVVKEDTVEYKVSALNVRPNATLEDALKKAPGVDVDPSTGAVTAQGQSVTKVRINGKDYMGGDVASLTKNIPADLLESIQIVDDYGDQANLTGIKTGDPVKVLNVNIRKDKNYGYSLQATAGDGRDALPSPQENDNRYLGSLNLFDFKGDRQISVLGSINNTNVNTFSFGSTTGGFGGGGAGGNFGGGGGGGRGNAARASSGLTSNTNGITDAHSIGANFRDQWGKHLAVYGSYSFADNTTFTNTTSNQVNTGSNPSSTDQKSLETDNNINHRFTWNMEYKPDTINYLKVTPTFSYAKTLTNATDDVVNKLTSATTGALTTNTAYNSATYANSSSPSLGLTALYNHRFNGHGRNLSVNVTLSTTKNDQSQNPIYNYTVGTPLAPANQLINTNGKTQTVGATFSYIEPLSKVSFLEFNYAYNHSYTSSDKQTDTLTVLAPQVYQPYALLSNDYNFTFTTNRVGLNYRVVEKKYNYTLGLGIQPSTLDGHSVTTGQDTRVNTVNFAPTARFVYNFARSNTLSINYSGTSNQPTFSQLQPVTDYSNALYPVQGNPDLKPEFANNISIRYNKFNFQTNDIIFTNLSFTQTDNKIVTDVITVPKSAALAASPVYNKLQNTILTRYQNADGYYSANGFVTYAKPWANRRYTLYLNGSVTYTNNISYVGSVDPTTTALDLEKNIAKNLVFTPGARFRVDITDIVDAQLLTSYSVNKTDNSVKNDLTSASSNVRAFTLGLNGKNYLWKNWTVSYDFSRVMNSGYTVAVTNPNILNAYLERRFLKNNAATIRASVFDAFNENTGYSSTTTGSSITQSNVNRLGRYYLLTFTLRLQKFAGRAPGQGQGGDRGGRRDGGGPGPGGPPPGGGNF